MAGQIAERAPGAISDYMTADDIARDAGVTTKEVYNWCLYHRYMERVVVLGKKVFHRDEYARFKAEHPDLIKSKESESAQ